MNFVEILIEKLEGKIKRSVYINKSAFMLKSHPLCQHYARFLTVPIMPIIMLVYLMQA